MKDFEWCTDCKEYDHEKHCCPRWNKVIRTTLNDNINAVLDDIRSEIKAYQSDAFYPDDVMINKRVLLDIIDKYKVGDKEE